MFDTRPMWMIRRLWTLAAIFLVVFSANAQTLRVAAAADLQLAMNDLVSRYQKTSATKVAVSYGSSGNFRTQIENGAPFDLFFSADVQYPKLLIAAGLGDADTLYVYARGRLVLWAPAEANLGLSQRGLAVLADARVAKIAIANPEHAPYGKAAIAALQKAGIYGEVKPKLVYGENISQAAQFVESGNAQVGILALSLTYAEVMRKGERWILPEDLYPRLEQAAVVIRGSTNKSAARGFLEFVRTPEAQQVLADYGFTAGSAAQQP